MTIAESDKNVIPPAEWFRYPYLQSAIFFIAFKVAQSVSSYAGGGGGGGSYSPILGPVRFNPSN